jgi:hypothetical protein
MPLTFTDSTSTTGTWTTWVSTATNTATSTTTWTVWCDMTGGTAGNTAGTNYVPIYVPPPPPETPEQQRERQARRAREQEEAQQAQARAEELLRDFLTAEQIADLTKSNYFEMISGSGRRYRVYRGRQGNVYLMEQSKATRKYCIHPDLAVPDPDTMLAQKLLLETDEAAFLRIANETVLT